MKTMKTRARTRRRILLAAIVLALVAIPLAIETYVIAPRTQQHGQ
jgi:hypothetical protein